MQLENEAVVVTIILGTCLTLFCGVIIFLFVVFNNKNKLHLKDKEITRKAFERTLLQSQLEIREQTLQHIAFELHDNLGQVASLIKINLNTLQLSDPERAMVKVESTKELVRQLITDLKSLSLNLNSDRITQIGLLKGFEYEIERINKTGQFSAALDIENATETPDANATIILYRMTQEILNNSIKHSQAKHIMLIVRSTEKIFTLAYRDDGIGFDVQEKVGSGSGLLNLKTRAALINATVSIESSSGHGTSILIELPLNNVTR